MRNTRRTLLGAPVGRILTVAFWLSLATSTSAQSVAASRLVVTPLVLRLDVGGTGSIRTTAYDNKGVALASDKYQPTFKLADTTVASVDTHGLVTGLTAGSTQLTVQVNDLLRDVIIRVGSPSAAPVAVAAPGTRHPVLLEIAPNPLLLLPSERAHPAVTALYDDGSHELLAAVTWAVFGKEAMFDSASGDVVGLAPGNAVLGVRSADGTSASVPINIVPVAIEITRDSVLLEEGVDDTVPIVVPAQKGRRLQRGFKWHAGNGDIVRVSNPALGIVHGVAVGTSEVIADGYGLSKHIPVRVYRHVEFVRFRPDPSTPLRLAAGAAASVTAEPLAADSTPVMAVAPSWTVVDTSVATFDPQTRRLVGRRTGRTTLECHFRGFATTVWPIEIVDGTFSIDRGSPRVLTTGIITKATASYRDGQHASLGASATTRWVTTNDAVLAVDSAGTLTPRRVGHAVVSATGPGGVRDSILVLVTGDVLATKWISAHQSRLVTFSIENPKPAALADTNQITRDGAWSPDRTRIAYVSDGATRGDKWTVYVADADGGRAHPITALGDGFEHPTWSPDGRTIAVSMGRIGRKMQLVTLSPDSTTQIPKPLGRDRLSLRWPAYDSGGASVIALGERGDEHHIYRVHGNDEVAITTGRNAEAHPIVLTDGSVLYLADSGGKGAAARVMRAPAGGGVPSVIVGPDALPGVIDLAASPDGQRLVLVVSTTETVKGQKRKRSTLYVVAHSGAAPVPLRLNETDEFSDPAL